ncbi:MAG: preprotein translocase subunit SecG, partial [Corynebacterium variabile]
GGMQSSLSGSTVVEKNLDRLTIITAVIWVLAIVSLNLVLNYDL